MAAFVMGHLEQGVPVRVREYQPRVAVPLSAPRVIEIGSVVFTCPVTQRDSESGIIMAAASLSGVAHLRARFHCRVCGAVHVGLMADARLRPLCVSGSPTTG